MSLRFRSAQTQQRFFALLLCYSLLLTYVAPLAVARGKRFSLATGRPQQNEAALTGAPEGVFPNLDEVKVLQLPQPIAPPSVPSTLRSRRNPLEPLTVKHVGDPLPSLSPSPSPLPSPLPSPSALPSASPLPSISPLPSPLVRLGSAAPTTPWTKSANGEELLQYLLAWNRSYPTLLESGYAAFQPHHLTEPFSDSPFSQLPPSISSNAAFDFFMPPMPQAGSTRLVFTSNRDSNTQIYSMNVDGSGLIRLTNNSYNDDHPRWSPNGTKILFQSDRNTVPPDPDNPGPAKQDIYVMNADGSGQTQLTTDTADDCNAVWSPDGSKIVFQSLRNGSYYQVYSMNADGTSQTNLSNGAAADDQPSWSPNGSKIAFASERDHAAAPSIYVMNANGLSQTRLTFSSEIVRDEQPAWSRNGTKVAFVSTRDGNKEIYVMNADGSNQARLTNTLENDDSPYWSPDGTQIVFRSERERDSYDPIQQLWMMNTDGTSQALVASNEFGDSSPSWNTTGNQLPVANLGGPYSGVVAQNVPFSGVGSFDPDGTISGYSWNFGDGGTGSGVSLTHTYASSGTYSVTLTVTDNLGAQTSATTTTSITTAASEQYLANFNQSALARSSYTNESSYWNDILRAAYPNGQSSMLLAVRELGKTLFESSEYAARSRDNHSYVYDLYKTYLMREPDASGWTFWEGDLNSGTKTREQLRGAFDDCIEFANIVATLTPTGSPSSGVSSVASARVDPFNQPGNGLTARDAEWSVSLLTLPGRAGLDLGLSLSYSSMVWTHSGPYIYFDEDNGWPSPGFRLGFPTIQEKFFDAQAGRNVYLLIAGGSRVSLRQVAATNVYEAADSSYLQLIDYGSSLLVRTTDGTQLNYQSFNNEWRCTQIKDRNGNFITVNYDWRGHITTINDTLDRTITFNYDTNANVTSITQSWTVNGAPTTHTWASFGWGTVAVSGSFSGVMVVGASNPSTIPVLNQVGLDDGSRFNFEYNASAQVSVIRRYSSDNVQRASSAYDYQSIADNCPRLSGTRVSADNWTGINGIPSEVSTQYSDPGDGSHTLTTPDNTTYKEFYGTGYQRGLPTQTEVWSAGVRQKWTTNRWTQDNTGVNYQTNPRVEETNIYDSSGNRRRGTVTYAPFTLPSGASCNLPSDTREYAGDASTILRRTHVDYRMDPTLDASYLERHIIGLVKGQTLYEANGGTETLMSKGDFGYDEAGSIQGTDAPARHDNSYDGNFVTGRANLSSVKRYDVTDTSQFTASSMKYNTAGALVDATDPLSHHTTVSYTDSFSDGNNARNTLAYPKTVTNADGYSSTVVYNFDFGAVTSKQTPQPNTIQNLPGPLQTFAYDAAGRVERVTATTNNAYTRYLYGPNYFVTLSTVNTIADEAYSNTVFDGMGRTVVAATNHPGPIAGRYSARNTIYDLMGRAVKQSNPTETDAAWAPAGDDVAGWLYTQQTYDWKGRPLITTNPSITGNPNDTTVKEASYSGCGCAGGEVVTLTDEGTIDGGVAKRRQQKIYSDVLGRTVKTEVLNWQGGSMYSTTVNTYNARDQLKSVQEYQGDEASGIYQETIMTYDGYGRLRTKHIPQQDSGTDTTWDYNLDDTVQKITDARGSIANFSYNNRHLVTGITYDPSAGITDIPDVSFSYDGAGNRTNMTDGFGSVSYGYNQLSRMTSETRTFNDPNNSTINGVIRSLTYDYNLAGQLTSVTDPFGANFGYVRDTAGRLITVTGSGFASVSRYVSNIQYRAWGAPKSVSYDNDTSSTIAYNARLQPSEFRLTYNPNGSGIIRENYSYYADSRLQGVTDLDDTAGSNPPSTLRFLSRGYSYDQAGRVTGSAGTGAGAIPYSQNYGYDAFGNMTSRSGLYYNYTGQAWQTDNAAYTNNRRSGWNYDADGRVTSNPASSTDDAHTLSYDAAGRMVTNTDYAPFTTIIYGSGYDGDGQLVFESSQFYSYSASYIVRSTVLGDVLTRLDQSGSKKITHVPAEGLLFATQVTTAGPSVVWTQRNPLGITETGKAIYDPLGNYIPFRQMSDPRPAPGSYSSASMGGLSSSLANPDGYGMGCLLDGLPTSCNRVFSAINNGEGSRLIVDGRQNPNVSLANLGWFLVGVARPQQSEPPSGPPHLSPHGSNPKPGNRDPYNLVDEGVEWRFALVAFHVEPQNTSNPCAGLVRFNLRDESRDGAPTKFPFISTTVANDFNAALQEINGRVNGGIGFNEVFRTSEHQAALYADYSEKQKAWDALPLYQRIGRTPPLPALPQGTSAHEAGLAFDIPRKYLTPTVLVIFETHGFRRDVPNDPIHLQWMGWNRLLPEQQKQLVSAAQSEYSRCH